MAEYQMRITVFSVPVELAEDQAQEVVTVGDVAFARVKTGAAVKLERVS
jgi:hypothetical protein